MGEVARIASQLRRSWEGPAWHGPSLREVLDGVTTEIASRRPIAGAHTIHELTLHIAAWAEQGRKSITEGGYVSLEGADDWPPTDGSWSDARSRLEAAQVSLREAVLELTDDRLEDLVSAEKKYTVYFLLHGIIQHNLYHAGQIALLQKQTP